MSSPAASLTKCCTRKLAFSPRKAEITDSAAFRVSASTTPLPCVLSSSFTISGVDPTSPIRFPVSLGEAAKAVAGMPILWRARIWWACSLSRLAVIPSEGFTTKVPIVSNWRITAVP